VSARETKNTEKYLWALEEMYKRTPQIDFAKEMAALYKEINNEAKYLEWTDVILKAPEGASDFVRHYELYRLYSDKKDSARTMEYAQSTLKAIGQAQNAPADVAKIIPDIRHELNHFIGATHFTNKRYDDAIAFLLRALQDKKYSNAYYLIGNSLWEQKKIQNARLAFAKAQLQGESAQASAEDKTIGPRAKDRMEQIHRSLQNNTLVGIERQYNRAKEMSDEDLIKPMD
jgi:tetratricopeptide (TPR) repeat protein